MFLFLTLSLPELAKVKIRQKLHISFRQIPKQKQHHLKVPTKRFHLSGHSRISSTESFTLRRLFLGPVYMEVRDLR